MELSAGSRHIQLHNLLAAIPVAGVGDLGGDRHTPTLHPGFQAGNFKIRVAQAKAEGEGRLQAEAVEIPVAHIDALFVIGPPGVTVLIAEFAGEGDIGVALGPGVRQLAGGADLAAEDVGHGVAALGTGLGDVKHRVDALDLLQKAGVDGAAAVDEQDEMGVMGSAEGDGLPLLVGQIVITGFGFPVTALAGLAAEDINAGVGVHDFGDFRAGRQAEIFPQHIHNGAWFHKIQPFFLLLAIFFQGNFVKGLVIGKPQTAQNGKAPVFQALQHRHGMTLVDLAGAGAALDGPLGAAAIEGHFFVFQRQGAVIFQQNHALASRVIGDPQVVIFQFRGLGR